MRVPTTVNPNLPTSWYVPSHNQIKAVNCPIWAGMVPVISFKSYMQKARKWKMEWENGNELTEGERVPRCNNYIQHTHIMVRTK